MTFSFNPALASPLDQVRQYVGDVDSTNVEFANETIDFYLGTLPSPLSVAYQLALDATAKYSRYVDSTVDHQQTRGSQAAAQWKALSITLKARLDASVTADAATGLPGVFVTGIGTGPTEGYGPFDYPGLTPLCAPNPAWPPGGW